MNVKQGKKMSEGNVSNGLPKLNVDAAGIDVGSEEHWVAVPEDRGEHPVRSFRCFTADLHSMAQWLKECNIKTVAMESTGVYWIPIFQVLDRAGFEVKLVNARHVKNVPGRKTDVADCQWLQRLHTFGLLNGSFRPNDQVCVLRSYWRHRDNLIRYASSHILHMQKALTEMNIQLHKVITDITGVTGMRIIRAIIAGERDPLLLANMKDRRIQSSVHDIVKSLEGDYRQEHLFVLKQAVDLYDYYHQQIEACDRQLEGCLLQFDSKIDVKSQPVPPAKVGGRKRRRNEPHINLHAHLYRITGIDFTRIDGLDVLSVQTILSEVGHNPDAFPSEKHFASWLGLCPDNRITGGKIKSSRTRKVVNRAADAFRLAAQTMHHSASALGGYYRRMRAKLGAPKAITATAHKLARIFYRLWKTGEAYKDPGVDYYEQKYKERVLNNMKAKAKQLGYEIALKPLAGSEVS
jgi:transposase